MSRWGPVLGLSLGILLLGAAPARSQEVERERPQLPRPPRAERDAPRRFDPRDPEFGLREDSLAPLPDTLPGIDIAARRQELAGGDFPERDSLFRALSELPGFTAIEYRGRNVVLGVKARTIGLFGEAQVNLGADVLTSDTIRYRGAAGFMSARGAIELVGAGGRRAVSDSVLNCDVTAEKCTLYAAETGFRQQGTEWRVLGNVIPVAQDTVFATRSGFTSCELDEPHYRFQAGRIKVVTRDVIVAWPVVLYVRNVPIFWLPFFAQDIRPGRRSGILPPRFGFNDVVRTSGGFRRQVSDFGYYWAINPYMDAQATLDWFSGNYTRINGEFRYRFLKRFIRGGVGYGHSFSETGRNLELDAFHDQELGLNTTLRGSVRYVENTQLLQDRSFDPRDQTQTIDSDVGLRHRFPFADLSLSARRRQFLSASGRTELTLPALNLSFSPITLFPAPRNREGAFNNLTLSGSGSFSRRTTRRDDADDQTGTSASLSNGLRLRRFQVSSSVRFDEVNTTPADPTDGETSRATIDWRTAADYQLDLMGSTTLRPTVSVAGTQFRSGDTDGDFVAGPTRTALGATLSTDVYGFFPGFGPFSRIRHKVSPGFTWSYSPEVSLDPELAQIPGFPAASGSARNELGITLRQTFEAKVRSPEPEESEQPEAVAVADSVSGPGRVPPSGGRARARDERTVTLLAVNTSGLQFDFERAKRGEPVLVTETLTNAVSSDLLRGLQLNMTHDLFEGSGTEREFRPFLVRLAASFTLRSGQGLGDLIGLGADRSRSPDPLESQRLDSRTRPGSVIDGFDEDPFRDGRGGAGESGPWQLSLRYSLLRARENEPGRESQSLDGSLSFQPTTHWSVRWSSQYNFTDGEFGRHLITLDRDLHRWRASFQFARSPNGNVIFQVLVSLRDAPDIKVDYDQRSEPPRR